MFQIAVPSFRRFDLFQKATYALLKRHDLLSKVTVFINAEDEEKYKTLDVRIVVRDCATLLERRRVIYDYYEAGAHILQLDDDVSSVIDMEKKEVDLSAVISEGFLTALAQGCRLWGVYAVANPFFMTDNYVTQLTYISGCMMGLIKAGEHTDPPMEAKGDFWWCCHYYKTDGKILRFNKYAVKANYYTAKGGRKPDNRKEEERLGAERVVADFPEYARTFVRKSGYTDIRLKDRSC